MLQLRGYVDEKHQLTHWGKVLESALLVVGPSRELEEAVLLAVELMRFDLLKPDTMFKNYSGAPINGTGLCFARSLSEDGTTHSIIAIDKRNCMLVSRVACLGKIQHQAKPYSGPLSRHLLAYQSVVSSVRTTLRDLFEMILAAMFLEGSVTRERDDWMDLSLRCVTQASKSSRSNGFSLPLYDEHSCALGNLTLHYLDELCTRDDPTAESTRQEIKETGQKMWITKSNFSESLEDALRLWDAVSRHI